MGSRFSGWHLWVTRWEKKLRNRGRGQDAGEGGGGKQLCFFSQRLSGPVFFCDGSSLEITHRPFRNSSLPSSRWTSHLYRFPKWVLPLWNISLRNKMCVYVHDLNIGWADTWEQGWSLAGGRAGPSLQSPPHSSVSFSLVFRSYLWLTGHPESCFWPSPVPSHSIFSFLRVLVYEPYFPHLPYQDFLDNAFPLFRELGKKKKSSH